MAELPHLRLVDTDQSRSYTSPGGGGGGRFRTPARDRVPHARQLKASLRQAESDADTFRAASADPNPPEGDVLTIRSDAGYELKADSLERRLYGIELLGVTVENGVMTAKVFVPKGQYVQLLNILNAYETEFSRVGLPKNLELVESIASISLATVRDLWQDVGDRYPADGESIWWEAWLRLGTQEAEAVYGRFATAAQASGLRVSTRYVSFPERVVTLVYGRIEDFARYIGLLFLLAELRRAKEPPGDYSEHLTPFEQGQVFDDLLSRLTPPPIDAPAVCLLDTGVNRGHPLLAPVIAEKDTLAVVPGWGGADQHDHGTEMAGIAVYGDLAAVLESTGPVRLSHRVESVKLLPPPPAYNQERDYGPLTIQAVATAELNAPERKHAFCLAITTNPDDLGTPTLWSSTIDQICSAQLEEPGDQRLIFVSAGNMRDEILQADYCYHDWNCKRGGIEDPAQAWNAVTVGAFTDYWDIRHPDYKGWKPVATAGDLSPTSRTSQPWTDDEDWCEWPLKPDIVMEGGNWGTDGVNRFDLEDLGLLTTLQSPKHNTLLCTTRDTSPATAAAARFGAIVWQRYPELWPETVRGLMVHSARWTEPMASHFEGTEKARIRKMLRCYGYGVPQLDIALASLQNSVTLLFEGELQPVHKDGSEIRAKEMHVHTLPWPVDVLQSLGEAVVTMRVTLSYFVEPSPGRVGWTAKHRYQSHGLRFELIRPEESPEEFYARLSRDEWDDPRRRPASSGDPTNWTVGTQTRCLGSLHSDWWTGQAAKLASCNRLAVYPVTGWWRERSHLNKFDKKARYSLIVTLETPRTDVDLYTPIMTEATVTTLI